MSDNVKRELLWLLPTVLLSMVLLYVVSWLSGWELRPGQPFEVQNHDHYILIDFKYLAIYAFTHVFLMVYTGRLIASGFKEFKLNLVMLVTYGYAAYVNYSLQELLRYYTDIFYGLMGVSIFLALVTIIIMLVRACSK